MAFRCGLVAVLLLVPLASCQCFGNQDNATCEDDESSMLVVRPVTAKKGDAEKESSSVKPAARFQTYEHVNIGNEVKMSNGWEGTKKYKLSSGHELHYGDAIALCGDFYAGFPPISMGEDDAARKKSFDAMFKCLDGDSKDPKRVYKAAADDQSAIEMTKLEEPCRNYLHVNVLGQNNMDHFPPATKYKGSPGTLGNWEAYSEGHAVACQTAADAGKDESKLEKALMQNACASHFVSDMFAAGHMRTPRHYVSVFAEEWMHNEDNVVGLNVQNKRGDKFRAYGDSCLDDPLNSDSRKFQLEALTESANAVVQAWETGSATECKEDSKTAEIVPDLALVQDYTQAAQQGNTAPLLVVTNEAGDPQGDGKPGKVAKMRDACNLKDEKYESQTCEEKGGLSCWNDAYPSVPDKAPTTKTEEEAFKGAAVAAKVFEYEKFKCGKEAKSEKFEDKVKEFVGLNPEWIKHRAEKSNVDPNQLCTPVNPVPTPPPE